MYRAAVRHFGSFEAALKKSGFDPSNIAQRRVWSRKLVISELRDFRRSHRALSKPLLREHDSGLLRVVRIYFRDLPAAAKAAGIRL